MISSSARMCTYWRLMPRHGGLTMMMSNPEITSTSPWTKYNLLSTHLLLGLVLRSLSIALCLLLRNQLQLLLLEPLLCRFIAAPASRHVCSKGTLVRVKREDYGRMLWRNRELLCIGEILPSDT